MTRRLLVLIAACAACSPRDTGPAPPMPDADAPPALTAAHPAKVCDEAPNRAWEILHDGTAVGLSRGQCLGHEDDGWHFAVQVTPKGASPDYELHLWVGDDARPRRAEHRTPLDVTTFQWQPSGLQMTRHGDTELFEAKSEDALARLWLVPAHAVFLRELMFRLAVGADSDRVEHAAYVPAADAVIPVVFRLRRDDAGDLVAQAGAGQFVMTPSDLPRITAGKAGGQLLYRETDDDPWTPSLPAVPVPRYVLPSGLQITPIEIAGAVSLPGELVHRDEPGPHPAVLWVGTTGPQERHGFVAGTSWDLGYHEFHDALAERGFVVLRYDDRPSVTGSSGGFEAGVDDARRALAALAARPDVDPSRVFIAGHHEGALVAALVGAQRFTVAGRRHRPAGVVMLAAPGRSVTALAVDQQRRQLEAQGTTEAAVEAQLAETRRIYEAVIDGADAPGIDTVWLREIAKHDPQASVRKLSVPVLLLHGDKDFQVDTERDYQPLRGLLDTEAHRRRGSASQVFPDVDHLFKPEPGRSTVGHYGDLRRKVSPSVIEAVVVWASGVAQIPG